METTEDRCVMYVGDGTFEPMIIAVGLLAAGALAMLVLLGWWVAGDRGTSRWTRRSVVVFTTALLAVVAPLWSFGMLLVDVVTGGVQHSPLWGDTTPGFRFAVGLFVIGLLTAAAFAAWVVTLAVINAWAAALRPCPVDARRRSLLSWAAAMAVAVMALTWASLAADALRPLVEGFARLDTALGHADAGAAALALALTGWSVAIGVVGLRARPRLGARLAVATLLSWPVVVVLRSFGSVADQAVVRVAVWDVAALVAAAVLLALARVPGVAPPRPTAVPRPSPWGYAAGAAVILAGTVAGFGWAYQLSLEGARPPVEVVRVPYGGEATVVLDARPYAIYDSEGPDYTGGLEDLTTVDGPAGPVPVARYRDTGLTWGTYGAGSRSAVGMPFATFTPTVAGEHHIRSTTFASTRPPEERTPVVEARDVRLIVGDLPADVRLRFWAAAALVLGSLLTGLVLIVSTAWRRRRPRPALATPLPSVLPQPPTVAAAARP